MTGIILWATQADDHGGPTGGALRKANYWSPDPSIDPTVYYTPGNGNPAVSTADFYHVDGLYWLRPYDLLTFGTTGATIAAANARYVWLVSPDHPNSNYSWNDGIDTVQMGFSGDPGVLPQTLRTVIREAGVQYHDPDGSTYAIYQIPYLVYNPDDASFPFLLFAEGSTIAGNPQRNHEMGWSKSADLLTWTVSQPAFRTAAFGGWSSFQQPVRVSANSWISTGLSNTTTYNGYGNYTSTDGHTFTLTGLGGLFDKLNSSNVPQKNVGTINSGDRIFQLMYGSVVTIDGQRWAFGKEDARNTTDGGMYVCMAPLDAINNILSTPDVIRISSKITPGTYPGPTYLQNVMVYLEDGIAHMYATRGFPTSSAVVGTVNGATYAAGGGLWEQFVDYYTYTYASADAAASAPSGVEVSCAGGTVTLTWLDILPNNTYRVYRGSDATTQATLVGDVTGTSTTDIPSTGQQWWYKVVTLQLGVERGSRVVHTYVSSKSALTNKHINRVLDDGADATTIDANWIESCVQFLSDNNLTTSLLWWADPAFGTKKSGSVVQKIYCLGTTRLPRGGDYTPSTANTLYSATGMNSFCPGWTNPATTDRGYFGGERTTNLRRKIQLTLAAAYKKTDTSKASFLGASKLGTGLDGFGLEHSAGTPGQVSMYFADSTHTVTATATPSSATGAHVVIGSFDGTNLTVYEDGVSGTPQSGLAANADLANASAIKGVWGLNPPWYRLVSGCSGTQYTYPTTTYGRAEAKFSASDLIVFEKGLSATEAAFLDTLLATHIGR